MSNRTQRKGFTIIEVVLVLAIAGLIFLMVFIALPALQRNQRDSQRKNDFSRLQTALTNYTSNNRGALPTNWTTFETSYLKANNDSFVDPSGPSTTQGSGVTAYVLTSSTTLDISSTTFASAQNIIYYSAGYVCSATNNAVVTTSGGGSRKVAFRMVLEGGGVICANN